MYISRVRLKNIRCFKDIYLDLQRDGNTLNWITILGDNGTGKTTFLKCLAIGLSDLTSAAGLLREVPWEFRNRTIKKNGIIEIDIDNGLGESYKIITNVITKGKNEIERLSRRIINKKNNKYIPDYDFAWESIFLCGYGAGRGIEGTVDYLKYSTIDAVYTLFRYDQPLQNPELAIRRLIQRQKNAGRWKAEEYVLKWLRKQLKPILLLEDKDDNLLLNPDGIWLKSNKWGEVPLIATGDGYKSTLTWVMDFISWASLYWSDTIYKEIKGIVLIDEIEQHLHPKWQKNIISNLIKSFPKVQFIAATHSPIVALNTKRITVKKQDSKLYYFSHKEKNVVASEVQEPLVELDVDQVLASEAFGHIYNVNPEIEKMLREMSELASIDMPNKTELAKLDKIKKVLKRLMFPQGTTLIEREAERSYRHELIIKNAELRALLKIKR